MDKSQGRRFPVEANAYQLFEEIGDGVSATVHRALCIPFNEIVAIKVLDLERCNNDMDGIRREVQTMSLLDHPNVLRAHCSFTSDRSLWVVMPFMAGGSCLHIMKSAYPEGFEESVIATLLRDVLRALVYLHGHGYVHRDVKAGNILIDTNGAVKLADFGVSACLFDNGDRQRSLNTFVGTPCWMAPEVMQQLHGYDFKADVWSFGITALELAHGHAPFSKYPPMKVLLMTLQNAPPGLDYERDKRFSKNFKAMVGSCLVKDPKKRPSAEKLLKHSFFKHARSSEYLSRTILDGLVPLGERFRNLKAKDADFLLQNKGTNQSEEQLSQQEYIRGVSAWNFNIEDLKAQAALIDDGDFSPRGGAEANKSKSISSDDNYALDNIHQDIDCNANQNAVNEDLLPAFQDFDGSLAASFPVQPLQALKGCFDTCDDDTSTSSTEWHDATLSSVEPQHCLPQAQDLDAEVNPNAGKYLAKSSSPELLNSLSGSLSPESIASHKYRLGQRHMDQSEVSQNGSQTFQQVKEANGIPEGTVVQRKGRFKVTSADIGQKGPFASYCSNNSGRASTPVPATSVAPLLQFILQQNAVQRDEVTELIKLAQETQVRQSDMALGCSNGDLTQVQFCSVSKREKELQMYAYQLQQRISCLAEDIQSLKQQNAQLQKQLTAVSSKEEEKTLQEKDGIVDKMTKI